MRLPRFGALLLVGALLASGLVVGLGSSGGSPLAPLGAPAATPSAALSSSGAAAAPVAPSTAVAPATPAAPVASGAGTFFSTYSVPPAGIGTQTCFYAGCTNVSNDPSLNLTTGGVLGVAFTNYTNATPCPAASPYALSEIGFVRSTNGGSSWSAPEVLGNPDCSSPTVGDYPSAWEPSLTSLANGTFVLAYVEYNVSSVSTTVLPGVTYGPTSWSMVYDRLVVTESYDGGVTWTTPTVINSSANPSLDASAFAPVRPWIAATGATVYLTWTNLTENPVAGSASASAGVHLVVSTDGGISWGAPIDLTTFATPGGASVATNPMAVVGPSGTLYVAYDSNFTFNAALVCFPDGCVDNVWTTDVEVAASTNNGSTFTYATAAPGAVVPTTGRLGSPFVDPSPQLAVDPNGGQLYLAFSSGTPEDFCSTYYCQVGVLSSHVTVVNSSTGGASWSNGTVVAPQLDGGSYDGVNTFYNPAIAVGPSGVLDLELTYMNYTFCGDGLSGYFCGPQLQLYFNSTDHGATFSSPILISDNVSQLLFNPNSPDGEYDTMIATGSGLFAGWTADVCPAWNGSSAFTDCYYPSNSPASGTASSAVQVSMRLNGTASITFAETGLPAGTVWTADVMGNLRQATAPSSLVVSGIPSGENISWNVTVRSGYGVAYFPTSGVPFDNGSLVTAATTVSLAYSVEYLLNVLTVPALTLPTYTTTYCFQGMTLWWDNPECPGATWNVTGGPGAQWVTPGTSVDLSTEPIGAVYCNAGASCYGDNFLNLSWLSWTGTGNGSANTTHNATSVTVNGPINETANFRILGWCSTNYVSPAACFAPNITAAFLESGLPANTTWGVTVNSGQATQSFFGSNSYLPISGPVVGGLMNYTVWTVPASGGMVYVPSSTSPVSPVEIPGGTVVEVNFTLVSATQPNYPVYVFADGLPAGAAWTVTAGPNATGVENASSTVLNLSAAGGPYNLSGIAVALENGSRYSVTGIDARALEIGSSWNNVSGSSVSLSLDGPTYVYLQFGLQYYVTVANSTGGTVNSGSLWVTPGAQVSLTATPDPGYVFAGWSGSGAGAVSSTNPSISLYVYSALAEIASFAPAPLAVYNVTVAASGLPADVNYTVGLGGTNFTGAGVFQIPGLPNGSYALTLPYVYPNASTSTRYVPSLGSTSYVVGAGGMLTVAGAGTLNLTFALQAYVGVMAGSGGSVSPSSAGWTAVGTNVEFTATPSAGYAFEQWIGSGTGGVSSTAATINFTVSAPAGETAIFAPLAPTPPATFNLTVVAQGLPAGVAWSVLVDGQGATTGSGSLVLTGLNGSYTLSFPVIAESPGTQYVPAPASESVTVAGPGMSVTVNFTTEYYVTLESGSGGSIGAGSQWVAAGSSVTVTATPTNGWTFLGWNGTGPGGVASAATSVTITPQGPVTEWATFGPPAPPAVTTSSGASAPPVYVWALVGVLLVVGLGVGWIVARPRAPAPPESPPASDEVTYGSEEGGAAPPPPE